MSDPRQVSLTQEQRDHMEEMAKSGDYWVLTKPMFEELVARFDAARCGVDGWCDDPKCKAREDFNEADEAQNNLIADLTRANEAITHALNLLDNPHAQPGSPAPLSEAIEVLRGAIDKGGE